MYSSKATVVDGVTIKNWIDIVVGDYGRDLLKFPYGDLTPKNVPVNPWSLLEIQVAIYRDKD